MGSVEAALVRTAGAIVSATGRGGRGLLVLIYHRVLAAPDPMWPGTVHAERFSAQMDLAARCFNVLPLSEALSRLQSRSLPSRALSVTFDDGYADNLTVAAPIMRQRGIPATLFIATDYLDGGIMFNDAVAEGIRRAPVNFDLTDLGFGVLELADDSTRRAVIGRLIDALKYRHPAERRDVALEVLRRAGGLRSTGLMLASSQLRELRDAGFEIGAHTASHPILSRLDEPLAREDIGRGKARLEGILNDSVRLFAYPNGRPGKDYDRRHVRIVRELGFSAAVSTAWGAAHPGGDMFQVPRVAPWDDDIRWYAARLVRSYSERSYALAAPEA